MEIEEGYLATGDSLWTISFSYRVGRATVGMIVPEVAEAIFDCLVDDFMPQPTKQDWKSIAEGFHHRWNFPNYLGSIDRKHVVIQAPVVDAYYRFWVIDVGGYGRTSDGVILSHSRFGEGLMGGTLDFPEDKEFPEAGHCRKMPYVLVGDEAFPLRRYLMRPFHGSNIPTDDRVGGCIGVSSLSPEKVELCVKATCILHKFMRVTSMREKRGRLATQELPEQTAHALRNVGRIGSNNATREALRVREAFMSYFNEEGAVPWQHQAL
ncbi:Protein ALP1-like [Merluccius polli]|uniref:Protein ALP1-like n=1 Tax=Merluccius polli TaxID=89951 RepID=A0AA47P5U9_MERPO|nr:Protein ALP1-like [Merluccius polli]